MHASMREYARTLRARSSTAARTSYVAHVGSCEAFVGRAGATVARLVNELKSGRVYARVLYSARRAGNASERPTGLTSPVHIALPKQQIEMSSMGMAA